MVTGVMANHLRCADLPKKWPFKEYNFVKTKNSYRTFLASNYLDGRSKLRGRYVEDQYLSAGSYYA